MPSSEVECDSTTASAYDLSRDPDHPVFYGDIVVRLQSSVAGSTPAVLVQQPQASADLSWVGQVVDLHVDGHVQVKWGDGTTSMVCMHGSFATTSYSIDLMYYPSSEK